MTTDAGGPIRPDKGPDLWQLPEILALKVRRRKFKPARRFTFAGEDREVSDAVEIEIRVSEPFPIRALGPVMWVGDEPLTIAESDGKKTYRFLALEPQKLQAQAPISLAWNTRGARRRETGFRFQAPER
ncbi:MAG TPA: hypothetical protein VI356_15875 [Myxococcales bacterium]